VTLDDSHNLTLTPTSGAISLLDTNVVSAGVDGAGCVFDLRADHSLNRLGATGWQQIDSSTVKFAVPTTGPYAGMALDLRADGGLYVGGSLVWGTTKDFAVTPAGALYWLGAEGTFWRINPDGNRDWLSTNGEVTNYVLSSDGTVYSLTSSGELDRSAAGGAKAVVDPSGVEAFGVSGDGRTVCALEQTGTLATYTQGASRAVIGRARVQTVSLPGGTSDLSALDVAAADGSFTVYLSANAQLQSLIASQPIIPQSVFDTLGMAADAATAGVNALAQSVDVRVCGELALGNKVTVCWGTNSGLSTSWTTGGSALGLWSLSGVTTDGSGHASAGLSYTLATPGGGYTASVKVNDIGTLTAYVGQAWGLQAGALGASVSIQFGGQVTSTSALRQLYDSFSSGTAPAPLPAPAPVPAPAPTPSGSGGGSAGTSDPSTISGGQSTSGTGGSVGSSDPSQPGNSSIIGIPIPC
jgi:hypothetical protein